MTNQTVIKPWGKYVILEKNKEYWIKKLFVRKGKRISLQTHKNRVEIWIVLSGKIEAIKGNSRFTLKPGDSLKINRKEKHRIAGLEDSLIIEVALGKVLEKDIIRLEDDYGRIK